MIPPLHVVTDDSVLARPAFLVAAEAILTAGGGRLALHLRGRATTGARLYELAEALRPLARSSGAALLANDRVDLALAADLDGVHLRERSLPPAIARGLLPPGRLVGLSAHGESAARASGPEVDYLMIGTVFATASHPGWEPGGPALLERVAAATDRPLVAIGGITTSRVAVAREAGAHGVAVLSGIWDDRDPGAAARGYLERLA